MQRLDLLIRAFGRWVVSGNSVPGLNAPSGDRLSRREKFWGALGLFAIGLPALISIGILSFGITPSFFAESQIVQPNDFVYRFLGEDWIVHFADSYQNLWTNKQPRDIFTHGQTLDRLHGQTYWVGVQVKPEQLRLAKAQGANQLMSGYIYGTYEAYIDERLVKSGGTGELRRPVVIELTDEMINRPDGFRFSLRIRHDMNEPYPDTLHFMGLATKEQIELHRRWMDFYFNTLPSMAMGTNLALGLFFFALWICGTRKQELAAFAAFGILHGVIQAANVPLLFELIGIQSWHRLNFVTSFYESLFVWWLSLSLGRIRSRWVLAIGSVLLISPWVIFWTNLSSMQIYQVSLQFWKFGTNTAYFVGAFICLSQARLVAVQHRRELIDSAREMKLLLASLSFFVMGCVSLWGYFNYFDPRFANALFLGALAAAVVHDYRRQELFVRRAPLSKYHQRVDLPESVSAVLGTVDLKRSEGLYRFGAERGLGGRLVAEIINRFYQEIVDRGGEVIQTEGDSITFFFDQELGKGALKAALDSIQALNLSLRTHLNEAVMRDLPGFPTDLRLRAAVDVGAIRPVWQRFEGRDVPAWEQARDSTVFLDLARLMEAESKLGLQDSSIVCRQRLLVADEVPLKEDPLDSILKDVRTDITVEIKHGRKMDLALIPLIYPNPTGDKLALVANN